MTSSLRFVSSMGALGGQSAGIGRAFKLACCLTVISSCTGRTQPSAIRRSTPPTSGELARAGEGDTVYLRRLRTIEAVASSIDTDSLRKLYVRSLDASREEMVDVAYQISCEYVRGFLQYGQPAYNRAMRRLVDSLLTDPAVRKRWFKSKERWPQVSQSASTCNINGVVSAPDSLKWEPMPQRSP